MKDRNEIKEYAQRVLSNTLWDYLPYQSQNIIKELEIEDQCQLFNELLRQKCKLKKEQDKVEAAMEQTKGIILQDSHSHINQNVHRFGAVAVTARYAVLDSFVSNIMKAIEENKLDPDIKESVSLYVHYPIPYNSNEEYVTGPVVANIKEALEELWFVEGEAQPYYVSKDDMDLPDAFIVKCTLQLNDYKKDVRTGALDLICMIQRALSYYIYSLEQHQRSTIHIADRRIKYFIDEKGYSNITLDTIIWFLDSFVKGCLIGTTPQWYFNNPSDNLTANIKSKAIECPLKKAIAIMDFFTDNGNMLDMGNGIRMIAIPDTTDFMNAKFVNLQVELEANGDRLYNYLEETIPVNEDWKEEYSFERISQIKDPRNI